MGRINARPDDNMSEEVGRMARVNPSKGEIWRTRGNRRALVVLAIARTWLGENIAVVKYAHVDDPRSYGNPQPLPWSELIEREG